MNGQCELLHWDSQFFGFPVGRVSGGTMDEREGGAIFTWCGDRRVRLLYFLAEDDVASWAAAGELGFRLVDVRVELVHDLTRSRTPRSVSGVLLREATPEDLRDLLPIAAVAHTDSRFFADPAVPEDKAQELFEIWLRRSVERAIADVVFVAEVNGRAVSYITATVVEGIGSVGLVGVGERVRGRGIGLAMVEHALDWFTARDARVASVVTQGRNIMAQRVYQRCGFLTASARYWFHRWSP